MWASFLGGFDPPLFLHHDPLRRVVPFQTPHLSSLCRIDGQRHFYLPGKYLQCTLSNGRVLLRKNIEEEVTMDLRLNDDYYEWYCDWCDTRNLIQGFRVIDGTFTCCACNKKMTYHDSATPESTGQDVEFQSAA